MDICICSYQVAEILKDRPSWYRDCRAVDVLNVLPTASGGTIELLYMQVPALSSSLSFFFVLFLWVLFVYLKRLIAYCSITFFIH